MKPDRQEALKPPSDARNLEPVTLCSLACETLQISADYQERRGSSSAMLNM